MKKRILSVLLAMVMVLALVPVQAQAYGAFNDEYMYEFQISTSDVANAAPGNGIWAGVRTVDGRELKVRVDWMDGFKRGARAVFTVKLRIPPWLVTNILIESNEGSGPAWHIRRVEVWCDSRMQSPRSVTKLLSEFDVDCWVEDGKSSRFSWWATKPFTTKRTFPTPPVALEMKSTPCMGLLTQVGRWYPSRTTMAAAPQPR